MRPCDVVDELGLDRNTLYARLHDARNGKLPEAGSAREVTAEQAEISRLRAELARSRRECVLLKNRGVPQHDRPHVRYASTTSFEIT